MTVVATSTKQRIYDRARCDENVAALAKGEIPQNLPSAKRNFASAETQKEWWFHYGWNRDGDVPAALPAKNTTIRKVQINDAYDIGRWWWRATDGIRETTWPGVYNRSRLPGHPFISNDHDWDCYAISGQTVTFLLPDEPWNHLEFNGGAFGNMTLLTPDVSEDAVRRSGLDGTTLPGKTLFERPKGQETTFHDFAEPMTGGKLRFTNVEQETPIGEFAAYYVHPGDPPEGVVQLRYRLSAGTISGRQSKPRTAGCLYSRSLSLRRALADRGHAGRRWWQPSRSLSRREHSNRKRRP